MKLNIIGLGYIGLPTAAMFTSKGCEVIGVDTNPTVLEAIRSHQFHIEEPGLRELLIEGLERDLLRVQATPECADVFMIAVPTPITVQNTADLSYLRQAVKAITPYLKKGNTVIVESTIPPRTIVDVVVPLLSETDLEVGEELYVAHCPERVMPGKILEELIYNDRIIGGYNERSAEKCAEIYNIFCKGELFMTNSIAAEMTKLVENTYRDVNIAFANELAKVSHEIGVDVLDVIAMANKHPRVNVLQPGPGVGGHCIAIDPYFILEKSPNSAHMIKQARQINNSMPEYVADHIIKLTKGFEKPKVAILGLAYKGDVGDYRESPALKVVDLLLEEGLLVNIYDPYISHDMDHKKEELAEAIHHAHCLVVLTDHKEFKQLDCDMIFNRMSYPLIFDTKNCISPETVNEKMILVHYGNLHEYI